jgi:hypothetical protein
MPLNLDFETDGPCSLRFVYLSCRDVYWVDGLFGSGAFIIVSAHDIEVRWTTLEGYYGVISSEVWDSMIENGKIQHAKLRSDKSMAGG